MATYWNNSDGLQVRFGTLDAQHPPGVIPSRGPQTEIVYTIVGTELPDTNLTGEIISHGPVIPAGALVTSATLDITTAFDSAGDAGTLDIGTYKVSDGTALDADGIDADIAQGDIDAVGDQIACDGAHVGGALITADCYLGATYETAAFTAGVGTLVVKYFVPNA